MLAATVVHALPDTFVGDQSVAIPLAQHFDDPDISGSTVEVVTPLGRILIETYDEITPLTAANFLNLVRNGNYDEMFFHRAVTDFVVQGGGFRWIESTNAVDSVADNGNVVNEFARWFDPEIGGLEPGTQLNVRGTIAMAKLPNDPNSADTQWFVNVGNNASNLDHQNGGFTVFARVLPSTMDVVDAIAALQRANAQGPFTALPVRDLQTGASILRDNVVTTTSRVVDELTYEVSTEGDIDAVAAAVVDGQLQLTPQQGQSGVVTISVTATDLSGDSVSSTFDVAIRVPLSSSITGPDDGSDTRPVISWNASAGAASYDVWVNHVGVQNAVIFEQGVSSTELTPLRDLAAGLYRAWVRVRNEFGESAWSAVHTFRVEATTPAKVNITSPATETTSELRPVIEWTTSAAATEYDLWVNLVGVKNQVIRQSSLTTTSFRPDRDLLDGTYRAWVMAKNDVGHSGWSDPLTFELVSGVLRLIGPQSQSDEARPHFAWSGHTGNGTMELWVNQLGGQNRLIHEMSLTGSSYVPTADLPNGDFRGWIREHLVDGPGPWSAPFEFSIATGTVPGIVVLKQVSNTAGRRPVFSWNAASRGVRYELWVNLLGGASRIIHNAELTSLEFATGLDLAAGTYRGWLRAFNADGEAGPWNTAFEFTIA